MERKQTKLRKRISRKEKEFAELMVHQGLGSIEAARKAFGWRCEPGTSEARKAVTLKKSTRVQAYLKELEEQVTRETEAHKLFLDTDALEWDRIRKYAFERLEFIRDDNTVKSQVRFNAIQALEKLSDPSSDAGLISLWLDVLWEGSLAHCPRCHNTFPLAKIENEQIANWRKENRDDVPPVHEETLSRRLAVIKRSDPRKTPHIGQLKALAAEERHLAGKGAARAGKSILLAWMALLFFLIPGVEIWVLARIYNDARSEVDYLKKFIHTLFYPYADKLIKESFDHKTGELTLISKWGSELKVRSARAKGSITGRELEAAFVAEPGWVPEDLYEELRARMSSRLGRIIMFGTPKGFGGILGRMLTLVQKDPVSGRVRRIGPEERTLEKGCPWGVSLLSYSLSPKDNPEYVKSELVSAKMELLEHEYASEFEGLLTSQDGAKFPHIADRHLQYIDKNDQVNSAFVLGIDQGPKNFAATLVGWNGKKVFVSKEYFESDSRTMKYHLEVLKNSVPAWIHQAGGLDGSWKLTILDADPPLMNELNEFEEEGKPWPTEVTFRPKNQSGQYNMQNWRSETYEFVNSLSAPADPRIIFSMQNCELLHEQMKRVQNVPISSDKDTINPNSKRWNITDPWRGDHVLDSLMLALWTILSNQLVLERGFGKKPGDAWEEARAADLYKRRVQEQRELTGKPVNSDQVFEDSFGRRRPSSPFQGYSPYKDY